MMFDEGVLDTATAVTTGNTRVCRSRRERCLWPPPVRWR